MRIDALLLENGTASAQIYAENYTSFQYTWSESQETPITGWLSAVSGATVSTHQISGRWYLHVWGYRGGNGTSAYASQAFDFGTSENPASPILTLSVDVDNTNWARSRTITVEKAPSSADVSYVKPGTEESIPVSGSTVDVTENGIYTFTLKSGDEVVEKVVQVSQIDRQAPILFIIGAGDTGKLYNQITLSVLSVLASDALSGIKSVEYVFADSEAEPAEGAWQTAKAPVDGKCSFVYSAVEEERTPKYLHVRVTDFAGNVSTGTSDGYMMIKEPDPEDLPAIQFTSKLTEWVKGPVELTWEVTNPGAGEWTVNADGILYPYKDNIGGSYPVNPDPTGTLTANQNGLYQIQVTDQNNSRGVAQLVVNWIDSEAPIPTSGMMRTDSLLTAQQDRVIPLQTRMPVNTVTPVLSLPEWMGVSPLRGRRRQGLSLTQRKWKSPWRTAPRLSITAGSRPIPSPKAIIIP